MDTAIVVIVCVICVAATIALLHERHRLNLKRQRFSDRERIEVLQQLQSQCPHSQAEHASMAYWWRRCAAILKVEEHRLRPDDRFDGILRPVAGFFTEDETSQLSDFVIEQCRLPADCDLSQIETLGELVEFLVRNSQKSNGPDQEK